MTDTTTRHDAPGGARPPRPSRRRRTVRRTVVLVVVAVLVGVAGVAALGVLTADVVVRQRYDARIERFDDPADSIPEESRPPEGVDGAMTFLLLGSDSRISAGDASQWQAGAQRTDAIMLVHLPADRSALYVMSVPRDTWVDIPGHGQAKINAAFSYGGPALMVQTMEQLTGLRMDHTAVVDFEGFATMTDALGGVTITVPEDTSDMRASFEAGTYRMDGDTALDYVRQRYGLDEGDFDRVRRQQNWVRAVSREALSRQTLTSPRTLDEFLLAATSSVSLDAGFGADDLRDLAFELRAVREEDMRFLTVPTAGTGRSSDGQSIVLLDEAAADGLFGSLSSGTTAQWVQDNDVDLLDERVE